MAKKTVKKATKEPKGSITRDKLKFTASWKIADADYKDGQQWTRKISYVVATTEANAVGASLTFTEVRGDEITEPLGTSVTSKVIKVEAKDYYPNSNKRLKEISVKVKGKRKGHENSKTKYVYTWSKWSEFVFAVNAPKNPVFSAKPAALYQDDDRRSHFIVSATSVDDKNHNPVSRLQWESILVKNAPTTDGSKQKWDKTVTGWRTGTTNTLSNYEVPIPTETIVPTDTDSWTRFVRVRAQGIGGDSAWVYNYHVYGKAYVPQVTEGDVGVGDGTLIIDADWTTPSDPAHPVDKITLQYCITEPAAGLTCPASASWTDAQVTGDTKAIDKAFYEVGQGLEDDQCLFYRVTAVHDNETTHSDPVLKYVGYLKQPTGLSVQINWTTKRATVTATNASGVADSFLAIYTNIGGYHCIGYIPHGQTSATVEIPDFANENNFAIGVRAVVGMWQNGLKPYAGKPLMESRNTLWQGGSVPKAPTNVTVEKTAVSGTVSVSWDWAWEDADSAQIAWSDNPLAWESTDEPSDYTITNLNPSRWYVAELATGQIWYFRVRLLQTNDDSVTYGAWSDMASINLSSAPNRPTLFLSDGVISADSMTKAYWAYVSTDTTPQAYAEICEATIDGGGITYGEPILHTQSEQHIDIYPNELGWAEGETHYLCVRVTSASGIPSEGWSEPVPLQIAAEMTCSITDTSLVKQSVEVNPITIDGNPVTFNNEEGNLEFAKLQVNIEPTQEGSGDPSPTNVRPIHGESDIVVEDVGKNLIEITRDSHVEQGLTFNVDTNRCVTVSGTFKSQVNFMLGYVALDTGDYIFTCGDVTPSWSTYQAYVIVNGNKYASVNGTRFTVSQKGEYPAYISIYGQVPSSLVIKPMVRKASITDPTYVPYQEPITITEPLEVTYTPTSTDTEPYLIKQVGDIYGDREEVEEVVGGTVAWNQLYKRANSGTYNGLTVTLKSDGHTAILNGTTTSIAYIVISDAGIPTEYVTEIGHIYLLAKSKIVSGLMVYNDSGGVALDADKLCSITKATARKKFYARGNSATTFSNVEINFQIHDLTAMFGPTVADAVYAMEQSSAGAGVAWCKQFPMFNKYSPYNAGELMSVKTSAHVTTGKNLLPITATVSKTVAGVSYTLNSDGTVTCKGTVSGTSAFFITSQGEVNLPIGDYVVTGGKDTSYDGVRIATNVVNSDGSVAKWIDAYTESGVTFSIKEGQYLGAVYLRGNTTGTAVNMTVYPMIRKVGTDSTFEPYNGHTYPLSPIDLRGIPKWMDGKLKFDGDIYPPSGQVNERYDIVDLGTLNWALNSGVFYAPLTDAKMTALNVMPNIICTRYQAEKFGNATNFPDKSICTVWWQVKGVNIKDSSYTDAASFKAAMSGTMMVYEKATATIETAIPFAEIQTVSNEGIEYYVDDRTVPIPVGHNTKYLTRDIFGGTLDLVSGKLVVDKAMVVLDGSESWSASNGTATACMRVQTRLNTGFKPNASNVSTVGNISSEFIEVTPNQTWDGVIGFSVSMDSPNPYLHFCQTGQKNMSVDAWKTHIASNPIQVVGLLATPQTYQLTQRQIDALLGHNTVTCENGDMTIRIAEGVEEVDCLTKLPLTVTVTGAGDGGTTILAIERDGDYPMRRPDETEYTGHDGETIALLTQSGEDEMTVDLPSLIGYLDDGARYRIVATTKDAFGQTAVDSLDFLVKWDEQAIVPDGAVEIDGTIAKLTPIAPSGVTDGAYCDIYRLSADRPELVYPNAEFGETYIDPYPAIGGGYRFVYKTKYGDYITEDDALAWLDVESGFDHDRMIVDFGGDSAELYYNIDEDDDWSKDFQSTQYLGGHIVGDWNPAVERTADISAVVITIIEEDTVDALRRLADYAGACHVRTLSGSSYTANVDVKRSKSHDHYGTRYSYGLKISKVDSQGYDGMPEDLYEVIS